MIIEEHEQGTYASERADPHPICLRLVAVGRPKVFRDAQFLAASVRRNFCTAVPGDVEGALCVFATIATVPLDTRGQKRVVIFRVIGGAAAVLGHAAIAENVFVTLGVHVVAEVEAAVGPAL